MVEEIFRVRVLGYCNLSSEQILAQLERSGAPSLITLRGEYLIVLERAGECYFISSAYGVCQYYYTVQGSRIFHGDTVLGVLKQARLPWEWNWRSLAELATFDHPLENRTLHPAIERVPERSVLHFCNGTLQRTTLAWEDLHPRAKATPRLALEALNRSVQEWGGKDPVVSISGGFDSRVLLASALKLGYRPALVTMGFEDSTDVIIAQQIASALGLELRRVQLRIEDYLAYGPLISALTNGTKTARHWHTYLYTRAAGFDPQQPFFVGTNGAWAKTVYFDQGIHALYQSWRSPQQSLRTVCQQKVNPIFKPSELEFLNPALGERLGPEARQATAETLVELCHHSFLPGLDRLYLEQRVRNFMGNGMKLYSESVAWRVPFLERDWVAAVWNLPRSWKLGHNWHRYALQKNYPRLLDFPEQGKAVRTAVRAPFRYWHPKSYRYPIVGYARYPEWFASPAIADFVRSHAGLLSELISPEGIEALLSDHQATQKRTPAVAFLVTMVFWIQHLQHLK